jgi:hypothetical protein
LGFSAAVAIHPWPEENWKRAFIDVEIGRAIELAEEDIQ